jgi:hypothetical protein
LLTLRARIIVISGHVQQPAHVIQTEKQIKVFCHFQIDKAMMKCCIQFWFQAVIFFLVYECQAFVPSASVAVTAKTLARRPPAAFNTTFGNVIGNQVDIAPYLTSYDFPSPVLSVTTKRALEIGQVMVGEFLNPVFFSLISEGIPSNWSDFWSRTNSGALTHAQRLAACCETLGPTYVKFAQAVSSRPDIVPKGLADALSVLQDNMQPFDSDTAKDIIRRDLLSKSGSSTLFQAQPEKLTAFLDSLSKEPVAAASGESSRCGSLGCSLDSRLRRQPPHLPLFIWLYFPG